MMAIRKKGWLLLCFVLLLQAGCSTGPLTPIEGPVDTPARFKGGDPAAAPIQGEWWKAYHDDVLTGLVEATLRNNPNLNVAFARLRAAREEVKATSAGLLPRIDANAEFSYLHTSPYTPFGEALGQQSIEGRQYSVGASVAWEPDLWGRVANAVEVADTRVVLARIEIDSYMLILCAEVVQSYWQMRSAELDSAILRAFQQSRAETEQVLASQYKGGLIGELELARARADVASAAAELADAGKRRDLSEHSLATLTGRPIADFSVPPAFTNLQRDFLLPPPPRIAPGMPADILARRPDLAASAQHIRAAIADRNIAETAFYPSIKLTGNFGFASMELRTLLEGQQFSLGPVAISLPIFDGGRNKANLAAADARYQEAVASHKSKLLLALKEVDDALTEIAAGEAAVEQRQKALDAARRAEAVARFRFDKGLATYFDVMDSQRTMLSIERAMLQNRTQALVASVQLVRALGGGWKAGEVVTPAQLYR
ncbi:efflux transporter outer membrane subunit [Paraburkholderia sp. UYCP14C]|uniref:efflux transporter outer membrane subunit n=1 Tax=Paraburkholderia sp. UYCP14C TaxID=2511130 RepID=UPI00145A02CF|nr:efflux transporter outer membrane subunit [Paraburkholderia sp. UYCP14C]